jgi:hypothetical protein
MATRRKQDAPFSVRGDTESWRIAARARGLAPSTWARMTLDAAAAAEMKRVERLRALKVG